MRRFLYLFFFISILCLTIKSMAYVQPNMEMVTFLGNSRQPIFITNDSFVFISQGRESHKGPQLYFKDLKKGKEKRITHQQGSLTNGLYVDDNGLLFYSSTTDEEKETPEALKKYLSRFPSSVKNDSFFHVDFAPQEIYQSRVDGSEIRRITSFSGYDGFPAYLADRKRLYFSRWYNGQVSLFAKSVDKNLAAWKVSKTSGHDLGLQMSPDQTKFTWFRFSPDFKSSQVVVSDLKFKDTDYLTLETGINWSPAWHPNGQSVLYSARNGSMKDFDLFEVSIKGECSRKITSLPGDEFFPTVSPNGKHILFTSTRSGSEQIYKIAYPGPLRCPSSTP